MGDALAALGRRLGLNNKEIEAIEKIRRKEPYKSTYINPEKIQNDESKQKDKIINDLESTPQEINLASVSLR